MSVCRVQASGTIELYFYGELTAPDRDAVDRHLAQCGDCRRALDELSVIRRALELRPDVAAPPGGDWTGFMARLQEAVDAESAPARNGRRAHIVSLRPRNPVVAALAVAALVTLVTISVLLMARDRGTTPTSDAPGETSAVADAVAPGMSVDAALGQSSEQHFEKSKLVVLGLDRKSVV